MARLTVSLLGSLDIRLDDRPVTHLVKGKARALLAYLAVEVNRPHRRETLAGLLWPDWLERSARTNLRNALSNLRTAIGDRDVTPSYLLITRETIQFNRASDCWVDVTAFSESVQEAAPASHRLENAIALYRGPFLEGFSGGDSPAFDDWTLGVREQLAYRYSIGLQALAKQYEQRGEYERACEVARQRVVQAPWQEQAHCDLMRLLALSGKRGAALAQYEACCLALREELDVEPGDETRRLQESIRSGEITRSQVDADKAREQAAPERESAIEPSIGDLRPSEGGLRLPAFLRAEAEEELVERPVFVAREHELERLNGFLETTLSGQGRVVFITGGPGRGKTALMAEFARRAMEAHPDLLVANGACDAYTGVGDPYLPFREVMDLLTGDVESGWAARRITREHARRLWDAMPTTLQVLMKRGLHLVDVLVPGPALLSRARDAAAGAPWIEDIHRAIERQRVSPTSFDQSHLYGQLTDTLRALAEKHPLLLLLDDVQWADTSSIGLLFHLGRHLPGSRILFVAAYRPEEVALGRDEAHSGERVRHPLDKALSEFKRRFGDVWVELGKDEAAEGRRFVDALLATEPNRLGEGFRCALSRHTGGHPLFTVELLRAMQERGDLIQGEEGHWTEGPALDWETLPPRVEGAIGERIGRLPLALQEVLKVASVEGEEFTAEVVARVQGVAELEVIRQLSGTLDRQHRLVRSQGSRRLSTAGGRTQRASRYRFRHFLFQSYLYNRLDEGERSYLHEAVGDALEGLFGEGAEEVSGQLARHYQESGSVGKAFDYRLQAGKQALRLSAYQEAIDHLTTGLAWLTDLPDLGPDHLLERAQQELALQSSLGMAWHGAKGLAPEAIDAYTRARELARQTGETSQSCRILGELSVMYWLRGEHQKACELAKEMLGLARQAKDPLLVAMSHVYLGLFLLSLGEYATAHTHLDQMIAFYRPYEHHSSLVSFRGSDLGLSALAYASCCLWCLGYPDQALQRSREALALARELGHPFSLADALCLAGCLFNEMGRDWHALEDHAAELTRLADEKGMQGWLLEGTCFRGEAVVMLGQVREGMALIREGIAGWQSTGALCWLPGYYRSLAEAQAQAGQLEEGLTTLDEALAHMEDTKERHWEAELYRVKGELLLTKSTQPMQGDEAQSNLHQAECCFQHAIEAARRQQARSWELRATTSLARLRQKQGRRQEAQEMLAEIYNWFTEGFGTADLQEANALLVELSQDD